MNQQDLLSVLDKVNRDQVLGNDDKVVVKDFIGNEVAGVYAYRNPPAAVKAIQYVRSMNEEEEEYNINNISLFLGLPLSKITKKRKEVGESYMYYLYIILKDSSTDPETINVYDTDYIYYALKDDMSKDFKVMSKKTFEETFTKKDF